MDNLWCKIESLRQEMHILAQEKGLSHFEVLWASQRLDEAINEIYKIAQMQKVG